MLLDPNDKERFCAVVTLSDLERARQHGVEPGTSLSEIGMSTVHSALPHEPISEVLERMARFDIGRMPVVHPRDRHKAVGWLRRSDVATAYYQALQRERELEAKEEERRLRDLTGQEIIEVRVLKGSRLSGKTLREAALPKESIVVAIRRRGKTIFPHGDTTLEAGDTVVASVAPGFGRDFKRLFQERG